MKQNTVDPVELLGQLVSIPSYVAESANEVALADFLTGFCEQYLPELTVEKQYIGDAGRYNVVIKGRRAPRLFVLGHIDTVRPKDSWQTDPFQPVIKNDRLYGLGAADMKGSIAAWLAALVSQKNEVRLDELMMFFYVDEEYDFKGIRYFVENMPADFAPQLALSLDGDLELTSGCRGLIEMNALVRGKSGHASNPANGVNAITGTVAVFEELKQQLFSYEDAYLGPSTCNLAYLRGGTVSVADGDLDWQREGNVIPDFVDMTLEVRTAVRGLNARKVEALLRKLAGRRDLAIDEVNIRHDIPPWPAAFGAEAMEAIKRAYRRADVTFKQGDLRLKGYIDAQMVAEKIAAPTFIIGAGGGNKHDADEYIPLDNLTKATRLYESILQEFLGETK